MSDGSQAGRANSATRWAQWGLLVVLLLSFGLRCYRLGAKSLWTDEGLTLRRAEQPLPLVLRNRNLVPVGPNYYDGGEVEVVSSPDVHPPLYFLLMHAWIRVAGTSEFALRFPSVIASMLALPLLFALGSALLTREAGLWTALLASLSPFYTWHAQEARMYAWVVLFSVASVYTFLPLLTGTQKPRRYAAYVIATTALLYTHYSGFLLLAFEAVAYAAYQARRRPRSVLAVLAVLVVALIPLLPYARRVFGLSLVGYVSRPLPVLASEAWSYFSLGLSESLVRPLSQTAPFLALFAVGALMVGAPRRGRAWVISLGYLVVPILLFHLVSYLRPNYMNPRHLLILSPAWELVMGQGLTTLRRRFWPGLVILLGAILFLRGRANHEIFASRRLWKDDIRGAAAYIEERARPGDAIVLHDPVIRLTFDYYYDGPYPETAIPSFGENDEQRALDEFVEWSQRYDRIWFLYGPPPAHFPNGLLPDWADANLFKVRQQAFEAIWTYVGVAAYEDEAPLVSVLPPGTQLADARWGGLHLTGFRIPEVERGDDAWLQFYWRADEEAPSEPLSLRVRLLDEEGSVWYDVGQEMLPFYPPSAWPADHHVRVDWQLDLPDDFPPITYRATVEVVGSGESKEIGPVEVTLPSEPRMAPSVEARFGAGIELVNSELGSDVFRAGQPLFGSLTWRASSPVSDDYELRTRLTSLWGRPVAVAEAAPSAAGMPTSGWPAGYPVGGRLILPLPADLQNGRYRVEIGLVEENTGTTVPVRRWLGSRKWLGIGTVQVEGWPLVRAVPDDIDQRLEQVEIAGSVLLRGYDLSRTGDDLSVTLYWQAERSPEQDYRVFVHVGGRGQPPLADAGGVPVDWTRPTTTWREGEVIVDRHVVSLSEVPPGRHELMVGLYDPATGGRPTTIVDGQTVAGGYVALEELDVD